MLNTIKHHEVSGNTYPYMLSLYVYDFLFSFPVLTESACCCRFKHPPSYGSYCLSCCNIVSMQVSDITIENVHLSVVYYKHQYTRACKLLRTCMYSGQPLPHESKGHKISNATNDARMGETCLKIPVFVSILVAVFCTSWRQSID